MLFIQMEYCAEGSLRKAIEERKFYGEFRRAWLFMGQVVEGLVHIHERKVIHRDLKPVGGLTRKTSFRRTSS